MNILFSIALLANIFFFNNTDTTWEARVSNNPLDPYYSFAPFTGTNITTENVAGYHFFFGPEGDGVPYGLPEAFSGTGTRIYIISVSNGPEGPLVLQRQFDP